MKHAAQEVTTRIFALQALLVIGVLICEQSALAKTDQTQPALDKDMEALSCASLIEPINGVRYWGDPDLRIYDEVYGDGVTVKLAITDKLTSRDLGSNFSEKFAPISDRLLYRLSVIDDPFARRPHFQTTIPLLIFSGIQMLSGGSIDPSADVEARPSSDEVVARIREEQFGLGGAAAFCYVGLKAAGSNVVINERCGVFLDRFWKDQDSLSSNMTKVVPAKNAATEISSMSLGLIKRVQQRWQSCTKIARGSPTDG